MTIIEFLLARIAEDEYEANVCLDQWMRGEGGTRRRWDRVLAECESKRRIVEMAGAIDEQSPDRGRRDVAWATVRLLTLPYADHPDYNEAWRP